MNLRHSVLQPRMAAALLLSLTAAVLGLLVGYDFGVRVGGTRWLGLVAALRAEPTPAPQQKGAREGAFLASARGLSVAVFLVVLLVGLGELARDPERKDDEPGDEQQLELGVQRRLAQGRRHQLAHHQQGDKQEQDLDAIDGGIACAGAGHARAQQALAGQRLQAVAQR
eukprot:gene19975-28275_t